MENSNVMRKIGVLLAFLIVLGEVQSGVAQQKAITTKKTVTKKKIDKTKTTYRDETTGMKFEFVKGGCFKMGDNSGDGEKDELPVHEVCVSDFYIGKYEVTQAEWIKVTGENAASDKKCGLDCPVESVSWMMVQDYIKTLNSKSGKQYRLPTEAEWEYAARSGGKNEKWPGSNNESELQDFVLYESSVKAVGTKKANGLGLHDMGGNIMEWCQDWYSSDYYKASSKNNPSGPGTGERRVLRGGLSGHSKKDVRASARTSDDPSVSDGSNGFRLAFTVK